jgi:hypothetical protein
MANQRSALESCELCLSQHIVWFACGLLAWLAAIWFPAGIHLSGLILGSIVIAGFTVALRMPLLAYVRFGNRWMTQSIWLLGCMASLNWFGFLLLSPRVPRDALPAALILLAAEAWLHWQAALRGKVPWLFRRLTKIGRLFTLYDNGLTHLHAASERSQANDLNEAKHDNTLESETLENAAGQLASLPETNHHQAANGSSDEVPPAAFIRRSFEGIDDQGRRYQSGEVRIDFATEQTLANAVITFCTAFAGTPAVDLEYEPLAADNEERLETASDELTIRPVHTTPTGLRLNLRRRTASQAAAYRLLWYAFLDDSRTSPPPARSVLP